MTTDTKPKKPEWNKRFDSWWEIGDYARADVKAVALIAYHAGYQFGRARTELIKNECRRLRKLLKEERANQKI